MEPSRRLVQLVPDSIAQLVEQLPAIVYLWEAGADGQCYYVSSAIESVLGHPADDWLADPSLWSSAAERTEATSQLSTACSRATATLCGSATRPS
jgi:hypothetical protein